MGEKSELQICEQQSNWRKALQLLKSNSTDVEGCIRVMFLILDILIEGSYTKEEHDLMAVNLKNLFGESYNTFFNDAEYLFFLSFLIAMGEWYFGISDITIVYNMRKQAFQKEPSNLLYEWGYWLSQSNKNAGSLAGRILQDESKIIWLNSKGLPGIYVLGVIENSFENYRK